MCVFTNTHAHTNFPIVTEWTPPSPSCVARWVGWHLDTCQSSLSITKGQENGVRGSATHCITMATTAPKFIACWDSSFKCVYICVFVWKNGYFSGCSCRMCLCFLLRLQLFPISRRQMLLPFSFAVANLRNLAWSSRLFSLLPSQLFFPLLTSRSGKRALLEGQPLSLKKESLTFHHLGLYCLFPFCLMPLSSSLWSSTSFVRNYFLIFTGYIAGEESAHVIVHKSEKIGLPGWQLTTWSLPSWWSVYGMNKKDNLCSQSGKIAQIEPPRTNHWPVYRTLITEVHQHSSSPGAPAATHEHSHLFILDTNDTTTCSDNNHIKWIEYNAPNGSRTCEHLNI